MWGLLYVAPLTGQPLKLGVSKLTGVTPIVAAAIAFVAFQGWQLLFYDQESIGSPLETIPRAVYVSIPTAVAIYVMVAVVTTNLAPHAIQTHPHVALADAASAMLGYVGLSELGFVIISVSALFSTGSAINATLFSSAHFAKGMLRADLLPDNFGSTDVDGVPERTILILGAITAVFTAWGSLGAITSFASLSFIVVFGSISLLALRHRDHDAINPIPPAIGAIGTLAFTPVMFWDLHRREPTTFWMVLIVAGLVVGVELLYFERDRLPRDAVGIDETIEADVAEIERDLENPVSDFETLEEDVERFEADSADDEGQEETDDRDSSDRANS